MRKKNYLKGMILPFLLLSAISVSAQFKPIALDTIYIHPWIENRPDGHEPANLMGGHLHDHGVWMLSFRMSSMRMGGNLQGKHTISNDDIFQMYMNAPQSMRMEMYMLGVMYGLNSNITLMTMFNFMHHRMSALSKSGENFETTVSGLGDIIPSVVFKLAEWPGHKMLMNTGMRIPLGKIDYTAKMMSGNQGQMPYIMQCGSGTFDAFLKWTYVIQKVHFSYGSQLYGLFRTGTNKQGYRLGNTYAVSSWGSYKLNNVLSISTRLEGLSKGIIKGRDKDLNVMMSPSSNYINSGGLYAYVLPGLNILIPKGKLKKNRFDIEFSLPVFQKPNGIQMKQQSIVYLTWQWQQ